MTVKRFFKLMDDMLVPDRWHIGEILAADGSEPQFDAGISCDLRPLHAKLTRAGRPLDFCVSAFNVPVAKESLAATIALIAGRDVQCIPTLVDTRTGFDALNTLRLIRCIDEDRSMFMKWTAQDHRADLAGQYRSVSKLRVDPRMIPEDAHFFRPKDWEVVLIVSEPVKVAMERTGCLGAKFQEVTGASELS
jgi:hypothetical protein